VSAEGQTPVRVLVVDDSEVFRNVLSALVAATRGFEVVGAASSGFEALRLAGTVSPDLVLVDLNMPELDGIETARRVSRRHPGMVVVLLTAFRGSSLADPSLLIEDKRDLSPDWLLGFWSRHGRPMLCSSICD
jgi:DNA-binding NarL/FixJ family response regulator